MRGLFQIIKKNQQKRIHYVPMGYRVYAVGDIHGRAELLKKLHNIIVADAGKRKDGKKNLVVYLGDYLDRGPYVKEALYEVISGLPKDDFHIEHLRGNHEQLFLDFLKEPSALALWLNLGGQSTLMNYRVKVPASGFSVERAEETRKEILEIMPYNHLEFINKSKIFFRFGDYLFVHAGIRPGISLEKQSFEDLLWIRDDFLASHADHDLKIIHGHTICARVQEHPNRIGIDTGAYATGVLTCVVLEDNRIRYLSTKSII